MHDLVIRGGQVVTPGGVRDGDVAVSEGTIAEVGPQLTEGREEIDARGLTVLPAVVDVHVHFNEPGRTGWEGAATGSRALAAGGGSVFVDMPLNSTPCTIGADDFDRKRTALEAASIADFGLWGGLVPGRVGDMAALAERGVVGFKAFMCDSGLPEFPRSDDATLYEGMQEAARLGLPVAVHAESEELTKQFGLRAGGRDARAFLASRPVVAELDAIQRALLFARETGAALHIVHVSSGRGVALAFEAQGRGVDVSIETCPHYLFFTGEDMERIGAIAKCAPPLRDTRDRENLWSELLSGHVNIVASDHSPCEPNLKAGDFRSAWGGIAGVQSTLAVLVEAGFHQRGLPLERLASLLASAPARRFRLSGKGGIVPGNDADLAIVDLADARTLDASELRQRHQVSPYAGCGFRCRVKRTIRRGETLAIDGGIVARTCGRFVRPSNRGESNV
jgi:allantoinase